MAFLLLANKRIFLPHQLLPHFFSSNPPFNFIDYLVGSFGFSPTKAAAISKSIAHLKSPQNPDAVRGFFEHQNFGESEIKTIITLRPMILCSSIQNTLAPNLRALRNIGLSTSALTQLILSDPVPLQVRSTLPRIMFWRDFFGGIEAALIKAVKNNRGLVGHDISRGIASKISLLQNHGISTHDIQRIVCTIPHFVTNSISTMEDMLKRAKEFGFHPESGMFLYGLKTMAAISRDKLRKKKELLKSFGWSEHEFLCALRKNPGMLCLSEDNLWAKMDFLLGDAKCDLSYLASHSVLLNFNLEKRLRPRNSILCLLESKDITGKRKDFSCALNYSDSKFVANYIVPHLYEIPELHEVFLAACTPGSR